MKTFKQYFYEVRSNPEQNPKVSIIDALTPYKNKSDYYISFTNVDKIGINPKSQWTTPNGIYTYPLKEIWFDLKNNDIPYAGNNPFVWLLKAKNNKGYINDLYTDYKSKNLENDIKKLKKLFKGNENALYDIKTRRGVKVRDAEYARVFWQLTQEISAIHGTGKNRGQRWNNLLRKLGYTGFGDRLSQGIIYDDEPMQAVFLTKSAFKVIDKFENKRYENNDMRYNQPNLMIGGDWKGGTWKKGVWENGNWFKGTWENGNWLDGIWYRGTWHQGIHQSGTWKSGTWKGGTWENGTWENGVWENGMWNNGVWKNGTWKDGTWMKGTWKGGAWMSGKWFEGFDKQGAYHGEDDSPDKW